MSSTVELDVLYKIGNAPVRGYPFPHFFVENIFPADYYAELQRNLPKPEHMKSLEEARNVRGYAERSVLVLDERGRPAEMPDAQWAFWRDLAQWMRAGRFGHLLLQKFAPVVEARMQNGPDLVIVDEAMLVHDRTQYSLGPHTDSSRKLVTLLFYLPSDATLAPHGTSIYVPKDPEFRCQGGPHHPFDRFDRMATMPFLPNSLFAFVKTDNSFHGVEPFDVPGAARWLLLFDLYVRREEGAKPAATPAPAPADPGQPTVQFKF